MQCVRIVMRWHGKQAQPGWALTLLLALGLAAPALAQVSFAPATRFQAGMSPGSLALGDINGDEVLDFAVPNVSSDIVTIRLGKGNGGFRGRIEVPTGDGPGDVALGDLNGDGALDLVVANQVCATIGLVSVMLGDGTGGFGPKTDFRTEHCPSVVALGDLDSDGTLDIVALSDVADTMSVLLGDGTGTFGPQTDFATGKTPVSIALGDLNGDSHLDAVVANQQSETVSVLLGDGAGGFGPRTEVATASGSPIAIALGDLDGDGTQDIVTTDSSSPTVSVLLGDGTGSFGPVLAFSLAGSFGFQPVVLGDLNRDGKLDIAAVSPLARIVSVLLNTTP